MSEMPSDFIRDAVRADNASGTYKGRVQTRFPPEPNGYLHIGHAKAITVDHGIARDFDGSYNLRFDDTNPDTENTEFVQSIIDDVSWLGCPPQNVFYASDYFQQLYDWAVFLIREGKAYVDDLDGEAISAGRGGFGKPGVDSPYRTRSVEENLDLFEQMRQGAFQDGACVLRAKIDMSHENMQMRDPIMYRIRHSHHHRTGNDWAIYPTYDWAHGQSDAIEGVTHSLCTLEFDTHRVLYDWFLAQLPLPAEQPRQIEFARLELTYTVTSKRRLATLVNDGVVDGWDDPRMPTLRGLKRRGYPAAAIRAFCETGTTRTNTRRSIEELESFVRRDLNANAQRKMAVLNPVKLIITNWPAGQVDHFEVANNPENPEDGTRKVAFSQELWIERDDFMEVPPPKFFRLSPGREVRLRGAYFVTATDVLKNEDGEIEAILATYDPTTAGGTAPNGRKVKSTMHWVSAGHATPIQVGLYERLFSAEIPGDATGEPLDDLNQESRRVVSGFGEASVADCAPGEVVQFERLGYFAADGDSMFHRTVGLRDEWAQVRKRS